MLNAKLAAENIVRNTVSQLLNKVNGDRKTLSATVEKLYNSFESAQRKL